MAENVGDSSARPDLELEEEFGDDDGDASTEQEMAEAEAGCGQAAIGDSDLEMADRGDPRRGRRGGRRHAAARGGIPMAAVTRRASRRHPGGHPAGTRRRPDGAPASRRRAQRRLPPRRRSAAIAYQERTGIKAPRIIAWEITRCCNLSCVHCRAAAEFGHYHGELSLDEIKATIDDIVTISQPDHHPHRRRAAHAPRHLGDRRLRAREGRDAGHRHERDAHHRGDRAEDGRSQDPAHQRLDRLPDRRGPRRVPRPAGLLRRDHRGHQDGQAPRRRRADQHDRHHAQRPPHRGDPRPRRVARRRRVPHLHARPDRPRLARSSPRSSRPRSTRRCSTWAYQRQKTSPLHFKPTDAPHYYRIIRQLAKAEGKKVTREEYGLDAMTRGCLGGITFCFISHVGDIQPCGYFDMQLGNVKEKPFSRDLDREQGLQRPARLLAAQGQVRRVRVQGRVRRLSRSRARGHRRLPGGRAVLRRTSRPRGRASARWRRPPPTWACRPPRTTSTTQARCLLGVGRGGEGHGANGDPRAVLQRSGHDREGRRGFPRGRSGRSRLRLRQQLDRRHGRDRRGRRAPWWFASIGRARVSSSEACFATSMPTATSWSTATTRTLPTRRSRWRSSSASTKADMVIGDRLSSTYFTENQRRFHNFGNRLVRCLVNRIFSSDVHDIMTGCRCFSRRFVKIVSGAGPAVSRSRPR